MGNAIIWSSEVFGFNCKLWQPWLHKLSMNQLLSIYNQINKRMANYNYMFIPNIAYPTLYYITMPTSSTLEPLPQEPQSDFSIRP